MAWTSRETVRRLFRLRKPAPDDGPKLDRLRAEFESLALTVLELTPGNADQSAAIRQLRQALQWSIAAVVCAPPLPEPDDPGPNAYLSACPEGAPDGTARNGTDATPAPDGARPRIPRDGGPIFPLRSRCAPKPATPRIPKGRMT